MVTYYKIYSKSQDKYLQGTPSYHRWAKDSGRLFSSIGQLRSFITGVMKNQYRMSETDFNDWQIREFRMELSDCKDVIDIVKPEKIIEILKR